MYLISRKAQEKGYRKYWLNVAEVADRLLEQGKIPRAVWRDAQLRALHALNPREIGRMTGIGSKP